MLQKLVAFADEFGNSSMDFDEQGTHFIVATVIARQENLGSLEEQVSELRRKHNFQTGEIKSSGVAGNFVWRKQILADIAKLDMNIYAVVVDKRKLSGEGFSHKKSFHKFLNNLLYKELFRTFPSMDLYVDEHGGQEFIREFKTYVEKHHSRTLFSGSEFNVVNSKKTSLIQVADFVAGTLGHIFDETKRTEHSQEFKRLLEPKIASLNYFPRTITFQELQETNLDESFDQRIAGACYSRVQDFLDREIASDQQKRDQIQFLKLLLWLQRANVTNRYISTTEIFGHLNQSRSRNLQQEYFRTKVVGNLRDKGVLIASGRKGYKIPTSARDLDTFITHGKRIILPMLSRLKEARSAIKLATGNELDLLNNIEYSRLKQILEIG